MKKQILLTSLLTLLPLAGSAQESDSNINDVKKLTFEDYCKDENASNAIKHTVSLLKNEVEKEECGAAFDELKKLTQLVLNNKEIEDISPLSGLTSLKVLDRVAENFCVTVAILIA